jgi:response regulator RpfG family c-di-GMP phosphodiesterase
MAAGVRLNLDGTVEAYGAPEPPPVPAEVTNFQARAALRRAGHLDRVHTALQAAQGEAWDAWEYANHLYRNGALVQAFASQLGFTEAQIDDLFRVAASIEA